MRFVNINIEGPDCSGKTTLFNALHAATNFKYNIQDRSCMSMYAFAKLYERKDQSFWYNKIFDDLKRLDTVYVMLLPSDKVLLDRLSLRGDEFQSRESLLRLKNLFVEIKQDFEELPNVLVIKETDLDTNIKSIIREIDLLNKKNAAALIKDFVYNSKKNEIIDIQCKELVSRDSLDYDVLNFPKEREYYQGIDQKIKQKLFREFSGMNEYGKPQTHESRRFVYADESCISLIHFLFRGGKLNVSATFRSSCIADTLWADYEFLKILSVECAEEMRLDDVPIELTINLRSAHIVP